MTLRLPVLLAAALAAATIAPAAAQEEYPRMNLRLAHAFPATWAQTEVDQWWADQIRERSGGNIRINMMWAGAGGAPLEILNLVGSGAVPLGAVPPSYFSNELPLTSAPNSLPLTFTSNEEALRVMTGLVENVPAMQEELKANNIWPLYFSTLNTYQPLCNKPIATVDDFEGLRIRTFGAYQPALWESLGAIGVNVLPAELYEGMQKGRVDCAFYSTDLHFATKMYEVGKHMTSLGFGPQPTWPIWVNYETWESWPQNVKDLFTEVSREAAQRSIEATTKAGEEALKALKDNGVIVTEFTDHERLREVAPDFKAVWLAEMERLGKGDEARSVLEYWNANDDDPNS